MERKAVGPVCCVMHVKEHRTLIVKEKGVSPGVSGFAPWAPSRVDMCTLQIFCIIIIIIYHRGKPLLFHDKWVLLCAFLYLPSTKDKASVLLTETCDVMCQCGVIVLPD